MRVRHAALVCLDAAAYAVVVGGALTVASAAFSLGSGGGLVGLKWTLFVVGTGLVGLAAVHLRPRRSERLRGGEAADADGTAEGGGTRDEGSLGRRLADAVSDRLPAGYRLPPNRRAPAGAKLFVAGVTVLGVSYVLEAGFGVGV